MMQLLFFLVLTLVAMVSYKSSGIVLVVSCHMMYIWWLLGEEMIKAAQYFLVVDLFFD